MDNKEMFVTTTLGVSGYFAVIMWWDPEGGFWEPWDTGFGRYETKDEAIEEAKSLAETEGLEYKD